MSKELAKKFLDAIENDAALKSKFEKYLEQAKELSPENILDFAKTNGFDCTAEDLAACQEYFYELSEAELDNVDAGFRGFSAYNRFGGSRGVRTYSTMAMNIADFFWRCRTGKWKAKGLFGRLEKK